jgi:hypothetical protein
MKSSILKSITFVIACIGGLVLDDSAKAAVTNPNDTQ